MPSTHYSTEAIQLFPNSKNKKIAQITHANEGNSCARNPAEGLAKGLASGSTAEHSGNTARARREYSESTAGAQREHKTPRTQPARHPCTRRREHSGSTARSTPGAHREHHGNTAGSKREHRNATDPAGPPPVHSEKHYREPPIAYAVG